MNQVTAHPDAVVFGIGKLAATAVAPYGAMAIAGDNRYQTAALTATTFFQGAVVGGVATGVDWPDALTGAALLGAIGGPLLLTRGASGTLEEPTRLALAASCGSIDVGLIFGSAASLTETQAEQVGTWIGGPAGSSTDGQTLRSVRAGILGGSDRAKATKRP
jgi:hypothetical protein